MEIDDAFKQPYNHADHEDTVYKRWYDSGYFNPDTCIEAGATNADAPPFSIVLPPPNVTGRLHTGHAAMITIEDIMVRYRRMQGNRTLWVPGTDHAAIATQVKVEKELAKKKIKKHEIGREAFLEHVNEFAKESHGTIRSQIEKMGASLDWSREAFTLDEKRGRAVYTAFQRMYDDGLIYRGNRIVNWDPKGQTTVSDDEVNHEEREATLHTFYYNKDVPIPIATTRLETKLGDTAIAVHPEDRRYQQYIGTTFETTFCGIPLSLTVIADEAIDPAFGTGAVGVTPAHSYTDWEMAQRHDIPVKQVINEYAKLDISHDDLNGMKTTEARTYIADWLAHEDLLISTEEITQHVSVAERTNGIIEPLPKEQWFIDVTKPFTFPHKESDIEGIAYGDTVTLKELMLQVVKNGQITIIPDRYERIYYHWIENLRDWCISRQIWYGHRIPVWYKGDEHVVSDTAPGDDWEQDPDTLDTWFSSGLWTFSTLGWPDETDDLATYHPTSVLETGPDIIFFWVARMILMSTYLRGEIPFQTVYFHGLVRDEHGRKISKSLGNNIDPVELIDQYSADAFRMGLIIGYPPGQDASMGVQKAKAHRKFANKLWNATRFVLENTEETHFTDYDPTQLTDADTVTIENWQQVMRELTDEMDRFQYHLVAEKLYHYVWHTFADKIIEEVKERLQDEQVSETEKTSGQYLLAYLLSEQLKALHPFMPFITETIWGKLPHTNELLLVTRWPSYAI